MKGIAFSAQARLVAPEVVDAFEKAIGCVLPPDYREFLLEQSGGYVDSELNRVDADAAGLGEIVVTELWTLDKMGPAQCVLWVQCQECKEYLSEGWLPVGTDVCGDLLLLNIADSDSGKVGEVCFMYVDPNDRQHKMLVLADSFSKFLDLFRDTNR